MLDRRNFCTLAVLGLGVSIITPRAALAKIPQHGQFIPSAYRVQIGSIEVLAFSDGILSIPASVFLVSNRREADRLLDQAALPLNPIPTPINAFLINTGEKLILVDSGAGHSMGNNAGNLFKNISAFGIDVSAIDFIVLTHLHPDHYGGLMESGPLMIPNAPLMVSEAEIGFWNDPIRTGQMSTDLKPIFENAQKFISMYKSSNRLTPLGPGREIASGVTAISAPGHTPGHTIIQLASGSESLLIFGDIVHNSALQFPHPEWGVVFDVDSQQAVDTRRKIFDMASADKMLVAGMHLPFPTFGHVVSSDNTYHFAPIVWQPV